MNELQVEDGIDEFLPAGWSLRVEACRKDYRDLITRYESLFDP